MHDFQGLDTTGLGDIIIRTLLKKLGIENFNDFKAFIVQFIKFGIVSFINTLLYMAIYYGLLYLGLHYLLSNITAYVLSVINAFYWNSKVVFKVEGDVLRRLIKVFISYGITLVLSTGIIYLLVDIFGLSEWIAPYLAFIVTIPTNFLMLKLWALKVESEKLKVESNLRHCEERSDEAIRE